MLLNVLVAIMNKTVEDGFEKARLEVNFTLATCVLHCEKTHGLYRIQGWNGGVDETTALVGDDKKFKKEYELKALSKEVEEYKRKVKQDSISIEDRLEQLKNKLKNVVKLQSEESENTEKQLDDLRALILEQLENLKNPKGLQPETQEE
ncbi:hypothetical protein THRCLA_22176 [Thraustotheca clavata]|uniref:Uncharacterized protein n=1 Tax=Thraustotheca clavata TaxID=74557 RepID=A0A1V9ZBA7_9STRA|nr:hypothetical protein THRCLA_22176 [Thraustotheca clavata]